MPNSFLLLTCEINKNVEVAKSLRKLSGVKEATPVFGAYDCVVKTEKMSDDDIKNLVVTSIRPLDDIRCVLTIHDAHK